MSLPNAAGNGHWQRIERLKQPVHPQAKGGAAVRWRALARPSSLVARVCPEAFSLLCPWFGLGTGFPLHQRSPGIPGNIVFALGHAPKCRNDRARIGKKLMGCRFQCPHRRTSDEAVCALKTIDEGGHCQIRLDSGTAQGSDGYRSNSIVRVLREGNQHRGGAGLLRDLRSRAVQSFDGAQAHQRFGVLKRFHENGSDHFPMFGKIPGSPAPTRGSKVEHPLHRKPPIP